ncbi:MAG: hypothetical protein WKF83_00830 [Nocardioidaceae bacterium]
MTTQSTRPAPGTTCTRWPTTTADPVRRTVLPGGLRVVTEAMPGVRSATRRYLGGRRFAGRDAEPRRRLALPRAPAVQGHRGALRRWTSPSPLDAVGGEMNAFTGKEYTCYHARVLDDRPAAGRRRPGRHGAPRIASPAADVESEREVILEEIAMHDDDPDDVVHNLIAEQRLGDPPARAARSPGTPDSIAALTPYARSRGYYRRRYMPPAMVVAVGRQRRPRHVVERVRVAFGVACFADDSATPHVPRRGRPAPPGSAPRRRAGHPPDRAGQRRARRARPASRPTTAATPLGVLNAALRRWDVARGCSRRSARSAAWRTRSTPSPPTTPTQAWSACTPAALPGKVDDVLERVPRPADDVGRRVACPPMSSSAARASCAVAVVLGLEDSGSRMSRIGKADLVHGELAQHRRGARPYRRRSPSTTSTRLAAAACHAAHARRRRTIRRYRPVRRRHALSSPAVRPGAVGTGRGLR